MTTLLITGSRNYWDRDTLFSVLDKAHATHNFTLLVEGGCEGADSIAVHWAVTNNVPVKTYLADWATHGRSAGPKRNIQMLVDNPGALIYAFPIGLSRGTRGCIREAEKRKHRVVVTEGTGL